MLIHLLLSSRAVYMTAVVLDDRWDETETGIVTYSRRTFEQA